MAMGSRTTDKAEAERRRLAKAIGSDLKRAARVHLWVLQHYHDMGATLAEEHAARVAANQGGEKGCGFSYWVGSRFRRGRAWATRLMRLHNGWAWIADDLERLVAARPIHRPFGLADALRLIHDRRMAGDPAYRAEVTINGGRRREAPRAEAACDATPAALGRLRKADLVAMVVDLRSAPRGAGRPEAVEVESDGADAAPIVPAATAVDEATTFVADAAPSVALPPAAGRGDANHDAPEASGPEAIAGEGDAEGAGGDRHAERQGALVRVVGDASPRPLDPDRHGRSGGLHPLAIGRAARPDAAEPPLEKGRAPWPSLADVLDAEPGRERGAHSC